MTRTLSRRLRFPTALALTSVIWLGVVDYGEAATSGQEIFENQCTACHTIGKGKLVGPDLAGVTGRREESWLTRQIKEPEKLIEENDPIAIQLLKESDDVPMVSLDLSDDEVAAVIEYLKSIEKQVVVDVGLPPQYIPTVVVSIMVLVGLTFIGLKVGNKSPDAS